MSFGRNPHVAKAENAEEKARIARDASAHEQAWREAARHWERASERETDAKRRKQYAEQAEAARNCADAGLQLEAAGDEADETDATLEAAADGSGRDAERESTDAPREPGVGSNDTKLLN